MPAQMSDMAIAFPHLGIYLPYVPKTIMVGSFGIAIYGICIALAMIVGINVAAQIARRDGQNPEVYWDVSIWLIIGAIVGARIYYVAFRWYDYVDDPIQIFNLRAGGLAIYGGILMDILILLIYCHRHKLSLRMVLDTAAFGLVIGQVIGRWGNFFNREVFGGYTDSLLAMRLPISMVRAGDISDQIANHIAEGTNYIQVHPTFLYEGLWNLGLFVLMLLYRKHKKFDGEMTLIYLGGYGIGRAWIEYIRTDQLYLPGTTLPVSLCLGLALAVFSVVMAVVGRRRIAAGAEAFAPRVGEKEEEVKR